MPKTEINQITTFPAIGTIEDPAFVWLNRNVYLAYQIAPIDGEGCALLHFFDVIEASIIPLNTEGLHKNTSGPYVSEFPIKPWEFNEIKYDRKSAYWKTLSPKRWQISFEDCTIDVIFQKVELKAIDQNIQYPDEMLRSHIEALG